MPRSPSPNRPPASAGADRTGQVLLAIARAAIAEELLGADPPVVEQSLAWLHEDGASFVTLTTGGAPRGCIGTLEAFRPLHADVRENAHAAAFRDRRFPRLTAPELDETSIAVSVLSAVTPMPVTDEADARARLRPHVDGVVLTCGRRRATFLPRVWAHVPDAEEFLALLKRKAGLPALFWSDEVRLSRYTVVEYHEGG